MMTVNIVMMMNLLGGTIVVENVRPGELIPIAWHPSRWQDSCVPEDEKKGTEKLLK